MTPPKDNLSSRRGAYTSAALLCVHLATAAAVLAIALIFRRSGWAFPNCSFYRLTGYTCISCGATRAVFALLRLKLARSFLLNPIPLLTAVFWLTTVGFELYCAAAKKQLRIKNGWIYVLVIFFVALAYNILRMIGAAPYPNLVN